MFCHQCGVSIPADASFCGGCGTRIVRPVAQTNAMAPPNEGSSAVHNVELARMATPGAYGTQTGGSVPRASRPRGVTILAVLALVTIIPTVSIGIALSGMAAGASAESAVPLMRLLMQFFPVLAQGEQDMVSQASFAATELFLIAAICAALGYGLWKLRKWARILAIVTSALFALHAAAMILASSGAVVGHLFGLGINIWIITYLSKPRVKQTFRG